MHSYNLRIRITSLFNTTKNEDRLNTIKKFGKYFEANPPHLQSVMFTAKRASRVNTLAASYLNTQGLNNSCLKSPTSTLVDLTFQSRALRSFSLNQLRNLSL